MNPIRRILLQYVNKGFTSVEELAGLISCSKRRIYYVMEGEKYLHDHEVLTIAQHFSTMGHNELSGLFLCSKFQVVPTGEVKINGCLHDENAEITRIMGSLISHFKSGDKDEAVALLPELSKQYNRVRHEVQGMQ